MGEEGQVGPAELFEIVEDPVGTRDAPQKGTEAIDGEPAESALLDGGDDAQEKDGFFQEDGDQEGQDGEEEPAAEFPLAGRFVAQDEAEEKAKRNQKGCGAVDEGGQAIGEAEEEKGGEAYSFSGFDAGEEGKGREGEVDAVELDDAGVKKDSRGRGHEEGGEGGSGSVQSQAKGGQKGEEDGEGHSQGGEGPGDDEEPKSAVAQEGGKAFEERVLEDVVGMGFGSSSDSEDLALSVDFVEGLLSQRQIEEERPQEKEDCEENRLPSGWMHFVSPKSAHGLQRLACILDPG